MARNERHETERKIFWEKRRRTFCFSQEEAKVVSQFLEKLHRTRVETSQGTYSPHFGIDKLTSDEDPNQHSERYVSSNTPFPNALELQQCAGANISFLNTQNHPMSDEQDQTLVDFVESLPDDLFGISAHLSHEINSNLSPEKQAELRENIRERQELLKRETTNYGTWDLNINLPNLRATAPDESEMKEYVVLTIRHTPQKKQK